MSSDYIPRLRQELLRAGATQPARWRPARVVRPLGSLAAAAAVVLIVVGLVIALPGGGVVDDATPASEPVRLEYRVVPASAAEETAEVMRTRLAAVGLEDARVSVTASAGLTIDAPAEARDDVVALTQRGVFAIYDWERSVLGPGGQPAPADENVTGGADAARLAATTEGEAEARAATASGRAVRGLGDGWFALGGAPALTNAGVENAEEAIDVMTKEPVVAIEFTAGGRTAFTTLTRDITHRGIDREGDGVGQEQARQHLAMVIDDRIVSVPYIDHRHNPDGVDGSTGGQIQGGLTPDTARTLTAVLNSGPLPGSLVR